MTFPARSTVTRITTLICPRTDARALRETVGISSCSTAEAVLGGVVGLCAAGAGFCGAGSTATGGSELG